MAAPARAERSMPSGSSSSRTPTASPSSRPPSAASTSRTTPVTPHAEGLVGSHRATLRPRATVSHRHTDNTELDARKNVDDRRASKRFNAALWPSPGRESHDSRVPLFHAATDPSPPPMHTPQHRLDEPHSLKQEEPG